MTGGTETTPVARPGSLDRLLGLFSDVQPGEGARALLMLANIFLILVVLLHHQDRSRAADPRHRVPASLQAPRDQGPAEVKTYAAAGQALVLMGFVPAYSWFASRVDRVRLIVGVTLFFVGEHRAASRSR